MDGNLDLKRGYSKKRTRTKTLFLDSDSLSSRDGPGRKKFKKCHLSSDEISRVIEAVRDDKLTHKKEAVKYGISARLVQSLIQADKKDPNLC